jgi:hypothetical protein
MQFLNFKMLVLAEGTDAWAWPYSLPTLTTVYIREEENTCKLKRKEEARCDSIYRAGMFVLGLSGQYGRWDL